MPASLLSLGAETLQLVAHYLDHDTALPESTIQPHWSNFASEIHPSASLDVLRFRSTCRAIRRVIKLPSLHVLIQTEEDLAMWMLEKAEDYKRAVKRVRLNWTSDIPTPRMRSMIWSTFTSLLLALPSLAELQISRTPFCGHRNTPSTDIQPLQPPPSFSLPKLKSLAIEVSCRSCCAHYANLFRTAAPNLAALKVAALVLDMVFKSRSPSLTSPTFSNLHTLALRIDIAAAAWGPPIDFELIAQACPNLVNLQVTTYDHMDEAGNDGTPRAPGLRHAHAISAVLSSAEGSFVVYDDMFTQRNTMESYIWGLERLPDLEVLDLGTLIRISPLSHAPRLKVIPRRGSSRLVYYGRYDSLNHKPREEFITALRSAQINAARMLAQACPKLTRGWWWDEYDRGGSRIPISKYRTGWRVFRRTEGGEPEIWLDPTPLPLTKEFVANGDGSASAEI